MIRTEGETVRRETERKKTNLLMGDWLANKINRKDLKPGDHIYSWRLGYLYPHHGIYVGHGMVIHFTRGTGQEIGWISSSFPSHPSGSPCPNCGYQSSADGVISSCLDCFLSGGGLYLFKYGVSLARFLASARGGTCTLAQSDPTKDVLHRAQFLLQNGFRSYHLFKNNCEDFAIYCKTGMLASTNDILGRSGQERAILAATYTSPPIRTFALGYSLGYYLGRIIYEQ